jgi:hypothetical protein
MLTTRLFALTAAALLSATPALAQNGNERASSDARASVTRKADKASKDSAAKSDSTTAKPASVMLFAPPIEIQHMRPNDLRGLNVFETPKNDNVAYTGFKLNWGAAFTQQFQNLGHSNTAVKRPDPTTGANLNQLVNIGGGFNNAVANLYLNAQLAPGIRVALTSYLSARHHQESWVKDGYFLIDDSPFEIKPLKDIMKYVTLKVGHFEVNYGDAHFRRTDNGQAIYNPLVGNLLMDAFTTEIGAEAYVRKGPFLAMAGMTGGETKGTITVPEKRSPAYLGKVGFDQAFSDNMRLRLTASAFSQARSANQSLYTGDRGGSRYYLVMENSTDATANAWSGNVRPGFASEQHAYVLNPFVKVGPVEFFGNFEQALGRAATEAENRKWTQNAYELTYRLFGDRLYAAGRYNTAEGPLTVGGPKVSVNRSQIGGGWFVTPNVLGKLEYVRQNYKDYPLTNILSGGKFHGLMIEGTVAF